MGLLGLLRKVRIKQKRFKVVVFGFDRAGKTTLIKTLTKSETEQPPAADEGFQVSPLTLEDFNLTFWDINGAEGDRALWSNYLEYSDVILFVFDAGDKQRLEQVESEFAKLVTDAHTKCPGASLLVVCTNARPGNLRKGEIVRALKLKDIEGIRVGCMACKPENEESAQEVLRWVCDDIVRRFYSE